MLYDKKWEETIPEVPFKPKTKVARRTWRTLLLAAADAIETDGWARGTLFREGKMCMMGAITYADTGRKFPTNVSSPSGRNAQSKLSRYVSKKYGVSIPGYNDRIARDSVDVVALMRRVAKQK